MSSSWKFLFDLDGTLTKKEILPEISREVGLFDEINELTYQTISGKIPFHESFIKRVDLFKSISISRVREIISRIPLNDELIEFVRFNSNCCYIVTGNLDVWVDELCKKIGVPYYSSTAIIKDDYVQGIANVLHKGTCVKLFSGNIVAVGEGNNDAEMIDNAKIGIAFGGVHNPAESVLSCATHAIYEEAQLCRFLKRLL